MDTKKQQALEKDLERLHIACSVLLKQVDDYRIDAGATITEMKKQFKHGEWMPYSTKLYARLKISRNL